MTEETPTTENPALKASPASFLTEVFSQANITTGLAVFAVILAAAPYVVPQLQAYQVQRGLMAQPAMIEAAQVKLQNQRVADKAKDMAVQIKARHDSIFNDKSDPVINPAGKIKVVEFLDYQCAYCRAATPALHAFLAENPDVQLIIKEYPVVHPPSSVTLAAYGMAAYQGGHYDSVHYALLTEKIETQTAMNAVLTRAGLDPEAAKAAATSKAVTDHINRTIQLGNDLGIDGTPTFIVGNTSIDGARIEDLKAAVEAVRAGK